MPTLRKAFQFFLKYAPYSTPPGRAACALELARAERRAWNEGITFEWDWDWDFDPANLPAEDLDPARQHEIFCCRAVSPSGETLAALCGVVDPTSEYRRVVEAELALEALEAGGRH